MKRFIQGALSQAPATLFSALFSVAVAAFYTRMFTPSEYGFYSFALAITGPLITLLTEWLAQPIGRFYNEYMRRGRLNDIWQLITVLGSVLSSAVLLLSAVGYFTLIRLNISFDRFIYFSAAAVVLFQGISAIFLPIFLASFRAAIYRRLTLGSAVLGTAISLLLIALFGKHVAFLLLGQAAALVVSVIVTLRVCGWQFRLHHFARNFRSRQTLIRFGRYGIPMMVWFFSASLLDISDRYAIQFYRGPDEMGLYSVNYGLISGLAMLINVPVALILGPLIYDQWRDRNTSAVSATIKQMTTLYAILGCFFLGFIVVTGRDLVFFLLGKPFHAGYVILIPVLIGRLMWGLSIIGQKALELRERTLTMSVNGLLAALANVLLNIVFVPRYGYVAAAYTTLVSYTLYSLLIYMQARRDIVWAVDTRAVLLAVMIGAAGVGGGKLAISFVDNNLYAIIIGGLSFTFVFTLLLSLLYKPLKLFLSSLKSSNIRRSVDAK